ncbi:biotin/lipoyl-binding protein [Candidatus Desantisbacteria bacterium]|nr:biotin/lipoyl-binding protein [Candidatus Desantisbacteria bacterium]
MNEHDLGELEIEDTDLKVKICRSPEGMVMPSLESGELSSESESHPETTTMELCSSLVGIFHLYPEGKDIPFVKTGSIIQPSQVLGRVRVMDIDNEIRAMMSGVITEILVKDGQPVEYDQPLFLFDPEH